MAACKIPSRHGECRPASRCRPTGCRPSPCSCKCRKRCRRERRRPRRDRQDDGEHHGRNERRSEWMNGFHGGSFRWIGIGAVMSDPGRPPIRAASFMETTIAHCPHTEQEAAKFVKEIPKLNGKTPETGAFDRESSQIRGRRPDDCAGGRILRYWTAWKTRTNPAKRSCPARRRCCSTRCGRVPGVVRTRRELLEAMHGKTHGGVHVHVIDTMVARLRKNLGTGGGCIETVHGRGAGSGRAVRGAGATCWPTRCKIKLSDRS